MGNCSSIPAEQPQQAKPQQTNSATATTPRSHSNKVHDEPTAVTVNDTTNGTTTTTSTTTDDSKPPADTGIQRQASVGTSSNGVPRQQSNRQEAAKFLEGVVPDAKRGDMLRPVPLLRSLTEAQRDKLGGLMRDRAVDAGTVVFHQGDKPDGFYIILEGSVRVSGIKDGQEITFATLRAGDYFGEYALVNDDVRGATVTAETPCNLLFLQRDHFNLVYHAVDLAFARRAGVTSTQQAKATTTFEPAAKTSENCQKTPAIISQLSSAFEANPLLKQMSAEQKQGIVEEMYRIECPKDTVVIKEGEPGSHLYVIEQGTLGIVKQGRQLGVMSNWTVFGELAILYNAPRAATITALQDCVLWVLDRYTFRKIAKNIAEGTIRRVMNFLADVPLLQPLTEDEREKIAEAVEEKYAHAGETIVYEGEEGNCMYILVKGHCQAERSDATTPGRIVKEYTKPGDFFGELALKSESEGKRKATVVAVTNTYMLTLNRDAFKLLLGPLDDIISKQAERYTRDGEMKTMDEVEDGAPEWNNLVTLGTLGKGSFGHVQLVKDKTTDVMYALKSVFKQQIIETQQQAHIISEKRVMEALQHPFLNRLYGTYKSRNKLHLLLEPCLGGELFTVLRKRRLFTEDVAKFYAGSVILAFGYLHSKDIVYRDLKPENLMLTEQGYVKVADFGFAKKITGKTYTLCGTPDYLAPEIVASRGHGKGVDWWTLGILIFEMIASYPPFWDEDQVNTYNKILECNVRFPSHFTNEAKEVILGLLERRPTRRLGVGLNGVDVLKSQPWFANFDWNALSNRSMPAPPYITPKDPNNLPVEVLDITPAMKYVDFGDDWDAEFGQLVSDNVALQ